MNYGQFKSAVYSETNKEGYPGLEDAIARYAPQALTWLERNYNMRYMRRFVGFEVNPEAEDTASGRYVPITAETKTIEFVRRVVPNRSGREFVYLDQIDPREEAGNYNDVIKGYWLDGTVGIWLDNYPQEIIEMEMRYYEYTQSRLDSDSATHWLIDYGQEIWLAQTMLMMLPFLREPELRTMYKEMRDEGLRTLIIAEEDAVSKSRDERMVFRPSK